MVQGGSLRYCSLRRRGFEPHPLHFYKRQQGQESSERIHRGGKESGEGKHLKTKTVGDIARMKKREMKE